MHVYILHLSAYIINGPLFKIYIKIHYVQNFKKGTYIHVFIYIIVPIAFSIGNVDIRNHVEVIQGLVSLIRNATWREVLGYSLRPIPFYHLDKYR